MLTLERAKELNDSQVTEHHLIIHAMNDNIFSKQRIHQR